MTPATPRLRWLIIVRRDRRALYWSIRRRFEGRAVILLDWRVEERRGATGPVGGERRREERRQPLSPWAAVRWRECGFRLLHRPDGVDPYEAEHRLQFRR